MPWSETSKMDYRFAAIKHFRTGRYTKQEISDEYGISRVTLNKWIKRVDELGWVGLADLTSKPHHSPNLTPQYMVDLILETSDIRQWKARRVHSQLKEDYPDLVLPSVTTVHNVLSRHGRTEKYHKHRRWAHPGKPTFNPDKPNSILSTDYKGEFRLGDGSKCYPLTIFDNYSRFLLGAYCHEGNRFEPAKRDFEKVFRKYGVPDAIVSDNGSPFCSKAISGLSRLNVWWFELGIEHLRTQPASPQQNGKIERMHREMKREVTRPPGKNMSEQQRMIDGFREAYNGVGHGGIGMKTPKSIFCHSGREFPNRIEGPEYPLHFEVRKVSSNGSIRWINSCVWISKALESKYVGFEEIDYGLWRVFFYDKLLGMFDESRMQLEDLPGRFDRQEKRK